MQSSKPVAFPKWIVRRDNAFETTGKQEDIEELLKYFFLFGKVIGVNLVENVFIRWCTRLLIPALLLSHATIDIIGWIKRPIATRGFTSAYELCVQISSAQFYGIGAFLYIYNHMAHPKFREIFAQWKKLPVDIPDAKLKKFSIVVPGIVMTSAILENICFHFKMFPVFDPPDNMGNKTSFEIYYERHHGNWALSVPFHPFLGVLLILANKFALYAWNYTDLLVIIMSRALRHRFTALYQSLETENVSWDVLWQRYTQLLDTLDMLESVLSPMVFLCFYINLYATCMQLHSWMTPAQNQHFLHTIYLLWSFVHLLARIFLVMHHAAELQKQAQEYFLVAQNCPEEFYTKQISRQTRYPISVNRRGMGISGLGCFVITKPFMLKFASVAFYFEVFLITSERIKCD